LTFLCKQFYNKRKGGFHVGFKSSIKKNGV
jgi:hypothetical protein